MPIWVPPTPPHDNNDGGNDWYIDQLSLMYESEPMIEDQLPPVWIGKKDQKKVKTDPGTNAVGTSSGVKSEGFGGISGEVRCPKIFGSLYYAFLMFSVGVRLLPCSLLACILFRVLCHRVLLSSPLSRFLSVSIQPAEKKLRPHVKSDSAIQLPKSLFDRPSPALVRLRKEAKAVKARGGAGGLPGLLANKAGEKLSFSKHG